LVAAHATLRLDMSVYLNALGAARLQISPRLKAGRQRSPKYRH
jgi:hypothetical protein